MITIQEMFNRAYLGLRSQGFERCMSDDRDRCCYLNYKGMRCAWGWVDTDLTSFDERNVTELAEHCTGIAGELDKDGIIFAQELQEAHDYGASPPVMMNNLQQLVNKYNLTIPK